MKAKEIPYRLFLLSLTAGASLIIGFLSFGGTLALLMSLPVWLGWLSAAALPVAFAFFALSVGYEAEIYYQNIKGALNKLFLKRNYLPRALANEYLLEHAKDPDSPQFFKDYLAQLKYLHKFGHGSLDKASELKKQQAEKKIKDMEKWFAGQLVAKGEPLTAYQKELQDWLELHKRDEKLNKLKKHTLYYFLTGLFSMLAAGFMALGTSYLLMGEFISIPVMAALSPAVLPFLIIPMALVAGAAYGFLIYNAITNMIHNDTVGKRFWKIINGFKDNGLTFGNVFKLSLTVSLLTLAAVLTLCTAGTWFTVARNAPPVLAGMSRLPSWIMGVINPLVTGLSSVIFNTQNTCETLDEMEKAGEGLAFSKFIPWVKEKHQHVKESYAALRMRETSLWQVINPFRILLKLTVTPLRVILFLGHLVSIGLTADRVPRLPEIVSALLGIISEGFEDLHYFIDHDHHEHDALTERLSSGHSHDHSADIPTRILKAFFTPLYALSALWASRASRKNENPDDVLNFKQAYLQQTGRKAPRTKNPVAPVCSEDLKIELTLHLLERHKQKYLENVHVKPKIANKNKALFLSAQTELLKNGNIMSNDDKIQSVIASLQSGKYINKHRFFGRGDTKQKEFVDKLAERVGVAPAA